MTNLTALPSTGFAPSNGDIASLLREQAINVESGVFGDLRQVVIVYETVDGQVERQVCGGQCDLARIVGLLFVAAQRATLKT